MSGSRVERATQCNQRIIQDFHQGHLWLFLNGDFVFGVPDCLFSSHSPGGIGQKGGRKRAPYSLWI
jgi:hypothetical protein